jgi:hypothetical protein
LLKFFVSTKAKALVSADKEREEEYYIKRQGECCGDVDLFAAKSYKYSALALEDCDLFVLDINLFERQFNVNSL